MDKSEVIKSLGKKSNGEIYLGVVGAVRTGKSTFIKKCIETLILPYMEDNDEKKRCMDEIPQTAQGKTIMTVEPKFVPSSGASINIDGLVTNIKLVDCVGYVTPESVGYEDELGNPRMVKTPWFPEEVPFVEAASIGTEKVITELKEINKPFIVIMNSTHPNSPETKTIATALSKKHDVPVIPISVEDMNIDDITSVLKEALYEFPVSHIEFKIPDWVAVLKNTHPLKQKFLNKMKESVVNVDKLRDVENINIDLQDTKEITKAYVSSLNTEEDLVTITLDADDNLFDDILKEVVGSSINSKGELLKVFQDVSEGRSEYESIKGALKQVYQTGYGIVLPRITDMKLDKPEIIKQGGRFGIKLKAKASSVHIMCTKRKRLPLLDYVGMLTIKHMKLLTMLT